MMITSFSFTMKCSFSKTSLAFSLSINRGEIFAIAGESGREGVIPLTDSQQMALLGEAIGKYININATIPVQTHAFLYGTSVFEGIRAYYNKEKDDNNNEEIYSKEITEDMKIETRQEKMNDSSNENDFHELISIFINRSLFY